MDLNVFQKAVQGLGKITDSITGIFKANSKGVLSSKRTISVIVVGAALTDISQNGITVMNLILVGIGMLPLIVLAFRGDIWRDNNEPGEKVK